MPGPAQQTGSALLRAVRDAFAVEGWTFHEVPGREVVEAAFDAHHTRVPLHVQAFPEIGAVSVVAQATFAVPPLHRAAVNDLLMAANEALTVGNFELWEGSGRAQVLFRATNLFPRNGADTAIIARLVQTGIAETDRLTPALATVLRTPHDLLPGLDTRALLGRDDFIPPPPVS
jgi:hypothetical protein